MCEGVVLAVETSGRHGSIALGRGEQMLAERHLEPQRRHDTGLMAAIAEVSEACDVEPADLARICVSTGPGSFTGLRVSIAAVKMLALTTGAGVVAVPTLNVLADNAPSNCQHVAVVCNLKRSTAYSGVFRRLEGDWRVMIPPQLRTLDELLHAAPRPVCLLGDPLPERIDDSLQDVYVLGKERAVARASTVWRIGRAMAGRGEGTDPLDLSPNYARQPEAVTLWEGKKGSR